MKIGIVGPQGYKNPEMDTIISKVLGKVMDTHDLPEDQIQFQVIGGDTVSSAVLDFMKNRSIQYRSHSKWLRKDALPAMTLEIDYALIFSPDCEDYLGEFIKECKKRKVKRKII